MASMTLYGCARVSSLDQDPILQEEMLCAVGWQVVRAEKKNGTAPRCAGGGKGRGSGRRRSPDPL
jgi:hypothetical protein